MSAFDRLIEQIDAFIRKYYKNEMLKGVLIFMGFLLSSWLLVSTLEYFGRFSSTVRLVLLVLFLVGNGYILVRYFARPVFSLYAFGKRINRNQAASIIGSFFPTISDRLLNTLQLNEINNPNDRSFELLRASVMQRSNELSAVPFVDAIRYQESKRYLRFLVPIALVFITIGVFVPSLLVDGSSRVVNYQVAQAAPFSFDLVSSLERINEGESKTIDVRISGLYIPDKVYIVSSRGRFLMKNTRKNQLTYTFDRLKTATDFRFEAEDVNSETYHIDVVGKSSLGRLVANLQFPKYLNRESETVSNVADLDIPEGTVIDWQIAAKNVKSIGVRWNDLSAEKQISTQVFASSSIRFSKKYNTSGKLQFVLKNSVTEVTDTASLQLKVIQDAYPSIIVEEQVDSIKKGVRLFSGLINDDYGLSNLTFQYEIKKKSGKELKRNLSVQKVGGTSDKFVFSVDFSREELDVEDKISYYFVVSDNDGVNGSKSTRSQSFVYELPTLEKLNENRDETQKEVQNALSDALKKADKFQKDVNKLQKSLLNKSKPDFKTSEQIQQLQQDQQQLQQELESIQEKLNESNEEKNKLSEQDEELLKQQELIDELMKEVMDDELKKLLDELEKLMQENPAEMKEESEKLDQSSDELKKQLDRTLEQLKRLQVNEKIDDIEKELDALAKEQEELKKDIEENKESKESADKKQDEINKKFDELKEDLKELKDLNEALERPMELGETQEESESIEKELKEASDKIKDGKQGKAGQNQKSAADQMKELKDQLNNQQEKANKKQNEEDMGLLRVLLENLMALSFSQEDNLNSFSKVKDTDPVYRKFGRKQRSIIDDTKVVEDSLLALAKRQAKIAQFIDKELKEINSNFGLIVDEIDEHRRRELGQHQQLVMTSYNNLALLLNESLEAMQQEAQSKPGSGSCDNPGGSGKKPGKGEMSSEDMKQMLKKQLDSMKKGPNPGGKQPGDKPGGDKPGQGGSQGMGGLGNKEIAKMAAQQSAIRQRLEQMRNELNKEGQGKGNGLNPLIKELEQQERDLINKNFTPELIRRQQDILTRLLESEKALKERGFEEKRESQSGKDKNYGNLIRFDEYTRQKLGQIELIRAVDPVLSRYYKSKASEYFNKAQ